MNKYIKDQYIIYIYSYINRLNIIYKYINLLCWSYIFIYFLKNVSI